ncbi:MAG: DNA cytosine methyltransferase [Ardenticatenales bacterium]|nr:DNA cytosine methyltransferase [Ardenticatenales bacterium]
MDNANGTSARVLAQTNGVIEEPPSFGDIFAGAGGLSLGLLQAGWQGIFAIEKSPMAFETLKFNLIDPREEPKFDWVDWLSVQAIDIEAFYQKCQDNLEQIKGLPLLAGGPPCQGYSRAGKRDPNDERNKLVDKYLELVELIEPQMLLLENVSGFATDFKSAKTKEGEESPEDQTRVYNADQELREALDSIGYQSFVRHSLKAKDFGVPQLRPRYILVAIQKRLLKHTPKLDPFQILDDIRKGFLLTKKLPTNQEVTLENAISDLLKEHGTTTCIEPGMGRFDQGVYGPAVGNYQKLMRTSRNGNLIQAGTVADSHRFPNHRPHTIERFQLIIDTFRPGIQLRGEEIESLGLNKHRIAPLAADEACHTLTSLPDDLVHYYEPRIPTVREYARIQSFPDWYQFKSKYTTGGQRRRVEVPRYTQVANAVPPLLAEALGISLLKAYTKLKIASLLKNQSTTLLTPTPRRQSNEILS